MSYHFLAMMTHVMAYVWEAGLFSGVGLTLSIMGIWLSAKCVNTWRWITIRVGDGSIKIRRFMHPIQWALLAGSLAACILAYHRYQAAKANGAKTAEARVALTKKWEKLRKLAITAGLFSCSLSTNKSMKELSTILRELARSFRDAMTLGTCMDEVGAIFSDDDDEPIKPVVKHVEGGVEEPKPKAAEVPKKPEAKKAPEDEIDDEALVDALALSKKISEERVAQSLSDDDDDEPNYNRNGLEGARELSWFQRVRNFWHRFQDADTFSELFYGHDLLNEEKDRRPKWNVMYGKWIWPAPQWTTAAKIHFHNGVRGVSSFFYDQYGYFKDNMPFVSSVVVSTVCVAACAAYFGRKASRKVVVSAKVAGSVAPVLPAAPIAPLDDKSKAGEGGKAKKNKRAKNRKQAQKESVTRGNDDDVSPNGKDKDDKKGGADEAMSWRSPGEKMDQAVGLSHAGARFKNGEASNCYQFYTYGKCSRGAACTWEHVAGPVKPCWSFSQDGKCKYGDKCKMSHASAVKKSEHLLPGKPVVTSCKLLEVVCLDRTGGKSHMNAYCANDAIIIPRHGVAGRASVSVIYDGKEWALGPTVYVSSLMPDQCWFKVPKGMKAQNNSQRMYRSPVIGETVVLQWLENGVTRMTAGPVGNEMMLGTERKIRVFDYHSSTKAGACGAAYVALSDNAIVGFHGIGSESVKVVPQFYGCNAGWMQELKDWSHSVSVNFSEDKAYPAYFHTQINIPKPGAVTETPKKPAAVAAANKGKAVESGSEEEQKSGPQPDFGVPHFDEKPKALFQ
jgi:hypothetical protein